MQVYVARQPIFDQNQKVFAYELLYRSGKENCFPGLEGNQATAAVIVNSFITIGLDSITRGKRAFINFTKQLLNDETALMFPPSAMAVEIIGDVEPDERTLKVCAKLKKNGYLIALDDFHLQSLAMPLLEMADIVKIDFQKSGAFERDKMIEYLKQYPVKLLAKKVETSQEFEEAKQKGFSYYQGFYFCEPLVIEGQEISGFKSHNLQLIQEICKKEIDFDQLEALIKEDLSLSYKLLRFINSAAFPVRIPIRSIRQAIALLGEKEIVKWVSLVTLRSIGQDKPDELTVTAVSRGRFCESLAQLTDLRERSADFFLMGLLSLLDVFLNQPMEKVIKELPLDDEIKGALLGEESIFKDIYELVTLYEKGQWHEASVIAKKLGISEEELFSSYIKSLDLSDVVWVD